MRDLEVQFQTQDRRATVKAVDGVNFDVRRGETFGIIGESGSGKTTIGRALVFLQKPTAGAILHNGIDPQSLPRGQFQSHRRDYQIIFQDPNAALNPRMTIIASVLEPLELARAGSKDERLARARDAMERVGLPQEIYERYPHQLSGGQKQRVLIARALTLRPKLIVCDEVVAALDMSIRGDVLNLFAELQRDLGLTYVFITHDLSVVSHISDRIAVMYLGRFVELGPTERVSEHADASLHPGAAVGGAAAAAVDPCATTSASSSRARSRARSIRRRAAASAPAAATRNRSAPSRRRTGASSRPDHWVACHFADRPNFSPNEATSQSKRGQRHDK